MPVFSLSNSTKPGPNKKEWGINMAVSLLTNYANDFVAEHELKAIAPQVAAAHEALHQHTGPGSDFLGWLDLPVQYDRDEFARIQQAARWIQQNAQILIVIGIGGSYLGARAAIELLRSPQYNNLKKDTPDIYFAGNSISPTHLNEILSLCEGRDIAVNIISKSGTTTEPALAFRVLRDLLEKKYGREGARQRIFATTDKARGTLKELSDREGYQTFVIPDDVGGRYSVLTAVGLLPIAVSGADITRLMEGAAAAREAYMTFDIEKNDVDRYAAYRNILYRKGRQIELLASYEPAFAMMNEWWKQLYGESEGKDNKGLFPASVIFSTDLHSMGQYIQEGARTLIETVVQFKTPRSDFFIPDDPENLDGLNFLSNQNMSVVNRRAFEGTLLAHTEGGVPNLVLEVEDTHEFSLGWLIYFFEKACGVSGYLLGVNPFDQPGVESYKKNMFALLGKPGYEDMKAALEKRLQN